MKTVVSIIIPVYNKVEYISKCVSALLEQQYRDYEIIIIDDGSTDGSNEMVDRLACNNKNINIRVYHQNNQGVAAARNVGIGLAEGEWIWFVDADDVPNSEWLSKIELYLECDKYDIIFSNFVKVLPDGKEEEVTTGIVGTIKDEDLPLLYLEQQYKTGYFGYLWCKLLRKSFLQTCQAKFCIGLTLAEDLKFLIALYENKPKCFFTDDLAYRYTIDANNSSKEKLIDYKAQLQIHYSVYLWIKNTSYFEKYESELKKHISFYVAFVFYYGFEYNKVLTGEFEWLSHHTEYKECLDLKGMNGFMKFLVFLLKKDLNIMVRIVLQVRRFIRNIYRKGIRK